MEEKDREQALIVSSDHQENGVEGGVIESKVMEGVMNELP